MRVSDLQKLLQERGLSSIGRKEHLVDRLATAAAGEMEEVEEEQHSGAFRNSSPTGLDTAAFSMTTAEESTPGNSSTMRLASGGNEHVCLDTAATNIAAAEEIGQVVSVTTTEAAGNDTTEQDMDTVEIPRTNCETDSLCCSEIMKILLRWATQST